MNKKFWIWLRSLNTANTDSYLISSSHCPHVVLGWSQLQYNSCYSNIKRKREHIQWAPCVCNINNTLFTFATRLNKNAAGMAINFKGTVRPDWICMRVVPLESPLKGHQPLYVWFKFKVLSRFMQNWTQPPACSDHGLHRILSSYWLAHCYWWKN